MHLALGRKTAYSIEALMYLADHASEGPCKARVIGDVVHVPRRYLPQILAGLVHAHLLTSVPGRRGGYVLIRAAEEITLLDIMLAAGGQLADERCQMTGEAPPVDRACAVHRAWMDARNALAAELQHTTLADLATSRADDGGAPRPAVQG